MIYIDLKYKADLNKLVPVIAEQAPFVYGDNQAHRITVSRTDGVFTGTVTADFINSAGDAVTVPGSIADGCAVVVLPQWCYSLPGAFALLVRVTDGTQTTTVLNLRGVVGESYTSLGNVPTAVETTVAQLIASYNSKTVEQDAKIDAFDASKANAVHTHSYNALTDKPTIPAAYDDTALAGRITAVDNKVSAVTEQTQTVEVETAVTANLIESTFGGNAPYTIGSGSTNRNLYWWACTSVDKFRIKTTVSGFTVNKFLTQPDVGVRSKSETQTVTTTDARAGVEITVDWTGWVLIRCLTTEAASGVSVKKVTTQTSYTAIDLVARDKLNDTLATNETLTANKSYTIKNIHPNTNIILSCNATYTGDTAPTVYATYTGIGSTLAYPIRSGERQEWRLPSIPDGMASISVTVDVPTGTSVTIKSLRNRFDNEVHHGAITYHSHFGVHGAPQTVRAALNAAKLGFRSFIVVPKHTSDGYLVCNHDDTFCGVTIAEKTLAELKAIDFGSTRSSVYAGDTIATVDEIFAICARTGMKPMFSCHSNRTNGILSQDEWADVKSMLEKYGILGHMQVKAAPTALANMNNPANSVLAGAYQVLGDQIDSYTLDFNNNSLTGNGMGFLRALEWYSSALCKIEYFDGERMGADLLSAAKEEGLTISCASSSSRSVERMQELIALGVKEFTEDEFFSFGLNW